MLQVYRRGPQASTTPALPPMLSLNLPKESQTMEDVGSEVRQSCQGLSQTQASPCFGFSLCKRT